MRRLAGLDGIRGLAALYVVIYHVLLRAYPGSAAQPAPLWAADFDYGRFAVVVFIVLSGFSLGVAPARNGWRMASVAEFAHRRAWRDSIRAIRTIAAEEAVRVLSGQAPHSPVNRLS